MARTLYPFSLSRRKNSPFYVVRFKDATTGKYLSGISTGKADKDEAIRQAFLMMQDPSIRSKNERKRKRLLIRNAELDDADLMFALGEMKRRGLVSSVTLTTEANSRKVIDYLDEFWDWEKSPYIREKLRQGHSLHKNHAVNMAKFVGKYWKKYFGDTTLGELTKDKIRGMFDEMAPLNLSGHTKNSAIRAVTTALKFAHSREIIAQDLTAGLVWFSEMYAERKILTPEMAQALFRVQWKDERARLANLVSMCTGMRAGEIRALRLRDLGAGCIHVVHSWNDREGLKSPKNGETRDVQFPFPRVIEDLCALARSSPFYDGMDTFIFYSTKPGQPIDTDILIDGLRDSLQKLGMSRGEAREYVFHSWRHFFATHMSRRLDAKLLQQQTGHKTLAMLEHYANHRTDEDALTVRDAQKAAFPFLLEGKKTAE